MKEKIMMGVIVAVVAGMLVFGGCESQAQKGAGIGALAGAGIGALAGKHSGKTAEGALIGAAVGGGAGYILGSEKDKKQTQTQIGALQQEMQTVTVNVTNSNGSITQVALRKQGIGYVGPRGEFYDHLPIEDELKPIYGF